MIKSFCIVIKEQFVFITAFISCLITDVQIERAIFFVES